MKAWPKRWLFLSLFFLITYCSSTLCFCETDFGCTVKKTSFSALLGKPAAQNAILELGMNNYFRYHTFCPCAQPHDTNDDIQVRSWLIDFFPFFFISTNGNKIAQYLLPNNESSIIIADNNTSDISSPWIDITSADQSFSSRLSLHPQRKEAGFAFCFFTNLYWLCTPETHWPERVWFEAFVPIEWVQHNLGLKEIITAPATPSTDTFTNPIAAFNSPAWNFGKLSCKPHNIFGVADILLRFGFDALRSQESHLAFYWCAFLATGDGLKSEYLFEPTLGNLGHTGTGGGINTDWCIWKQCDCTYVQWMIDLRAVYFFKHHETRSNDLVLNLNWSRYLQVAPLNSLETPLPGINFFTQEIEISPQSSVNFWTAFHLTRCNSHLEIGYNFWWRQKEKCSQFNLPQIVIYDIQGVPGSRTSASTATIATGAPGVGYPVSDLEPTLITSSMLSEYTPVIPNIYINSIYLSYGAQLMHHDHPMLISASFYYDVSHHNSCFSGIGGWIKGSFAF
jgi:hypothetical protein